MTRRRIRTPGRLGPEHIASAVLLILLIAIALWIGRRREPSVGPAQVDRRIPSTAAGYLFCHWNVENLFDDTDDPDNHDELEDWFARDRTALAEKHRLLTAALLAQNDGRGPDILALVEVENRRAVELLRQALNARLPTDWRYPEQGLIHRDNRSGRRIEPAILTRLPAREVLPRQFGIRRILAARIEVEGQPLTILESHWTSRVRGEQESESKRSAYADVLYQTFLEIVQADPQADLLIAGDFNDEPLNASVVDSLHAVADPTLVRSGDPRPRLLNLVGRLDPVTDGTYLYGRRWQILDHLVVSPGLLDPAGWQVLPETIRVNHEPSLRTGTARGPKRFGNEKNRNERGPSDHFAVTVRLRVAAGAPVAVTPRGPGPVARPTRASPP